MAEAPVAKISTLSTAEAGMLLISTKFSVPEAKELAAIRRPFTNVKVEEGPIPRKDAAACPGGVDVDVAPL